MVLALFLVMISPDALRGKIEEIARAANGRVGVAATVLETGESTGLRADERFPMQSVYKMPIGMAVLHDVDGGVLRLEQRVRVEKSDLVRPGLYSPIRDAHPEGVELTLGELLRFMVAESDGTACDVLLRLAGGGPRVTEYLRGIGVTGVVVATSEKEMSADEMVQYRNWATPREMVRLLRAVQEGRGLSTASRSLLLKLMTETPSGPQRIKGLLPEGTRVAHKTGSSGTSSGLTRATNDVGLITLPNGHTLAIAVFVSDSLADGPIREGVIAKITRAVWDSVVR